MKTITGIVFDIQRNSYVDGPGLRTTIFLKGCNLRCRWCHNPEGIAPRPQYVHYETRCSKCRICVNICPYGAITEIGRPAHDKCVLCGQCALHCPQGAIRIYGRKVTVGEILELLLRDKPFFDASGGGLTLSGGECMLQPEFVFALASLCRGEGIATAVDTAGNVPWEWIERVLPVADLFLYDLKAFDSDVHRRLTGVDNRRIKANIHRLLSRAPEKVIIRVPVIPGANDTKDNSQIPKIAAFLRTLPKPLAVELLPYHRMGESKREALKADSFSAEIPSAEHMDLLKAMF